MELLPLLLAVGILLGYQYVHGAAAPDLPMLPVTAAAPDPSTLPATAATSTPVVVSAPGPVPPRSLTPAPATGCVASQPRFLGGMAALRAAVGAQMGDALNCEHVVNGRGDTQQTTTTGLAYYLKSSNTPCFTTGYDHWAIRDNHLITWTGDSITPPQ